jgi:hypothetical protein
MTQLMPEPDESAIVATRAWVDQAVIGLNLCPFAKAPQVKGQVRYVLSDAMTKAALLTDLVAELQHLATAQPDALETTLLVHPRVLTDFSDFNDFLDEADAALAGLALDGQLQIASFHPQYRFAGTDADDVTNATNRSPYPTLHLLRETSVDRAVQAYPEAALIFERNMDTLRELGSDGWNALQSRWLPSAANSVEAPPSAASARPAD